MKKIDFKAFSLYTDLASDAATTILDFRRDFGNWLLARLGGVQGLDLALRIYRSDGPVELSDDEWAQIREQAGRPLEQGGLVAVYYHSLLRNAGF